MILVPYLLVGLYLIKVVRGQNKPLALFIGLGANAYGIWLLYGPTALAAIGGALYAPDLLLFLFAHSGRRGDARLTQH